MNNKTDPIEKLFCWSRQVSRNSLPDTLPVGFATRVLASDLQKPVQLPWWEYLALRGALAGGVLAAVGWLVQTSTPVLHEEVALADAIIQNTLEE